MERITTIAKIAQELNRSRYCRAKGMNDAALDAESNLDTLENALPSGSGIDSGTKIDRERSTDRRIVLTFSFHHMDDGGYYAGWTDHAAIVEPDFDGFSVRITGRDRNDVKDYLHDVYHHALTQPSPV